MANTTVKGKFNVVDENGNVKTIYSETSGDKVLVDRTKNASVIPNDVANLQHIVNKMGSLALKSKVNTSDFENGVVVKSLSELKDLTTTLASNKIPNALIVKEIENRVSVLENSNFVTIDDTDIEFTSRLDTEINDTSTSTSLTWSSKKISDLIITLNSNIELLKSRMNKAGIE